MATTQLHAVHAQQDQSSEDNDVSVTCSSQGALLRCTRPSFSQTRRLTRAAGVKVGVVAALRGVLPARLALALARAELVRQQELAPVELVQQQHLDALRALALRRRAARRREPGVGARGQAAALRRVSPSSYSAKQGRYPVHRRCKFAAVTRASSACLSHVWSKCHTLLRRITSMRQSKGRRPGAAGPRACSVRDQSEPDRQESWRDSGSRLR